MAVIIPGPHSEVFPVLDADFAIWGTNLGAVLIANPLWVLAPTPAAVAAAAAAFDAALVAASDPGTRSTLTVATKNAEKAAAAFLYRDCVRQLSAQFRSGVLTAAEINSAGVRTPDLIPTPIGPPGTLPLLSIVSMVSGLIQMRGADSTTPTLRAKPYGYAGLAIFRVDGPVTGSSVYNFVGNFTRQPMSVPVPPAVSGQMTTYFGRWYNHKGELGPLSLGVATVGV